jgi:hypothetical protein
LCFLAWRINEHLARWAMHKFTGNELAAAEIIAWLAKRHELTPPA